MKAVTIEEQEERKSRKREGERGRESDTHIEREGGRQTQREGRRDRETHRGKEREVFRQRDTEKDEKQKQRGEEKKGDTVMTEYVTFVTLKKNYSTDKHLPVSAPLGGRERRMKAIFFS